MVKLGIDTAKRVLSEAVGIGIHAFQFAGGEPTLCEDFMVEVFEEGRRLSMKMHRPPTNCLLGGTPEKLRVFLERLKKAGFTAGFRLSCDTYHHRIPTDWIARFIFESASTITLRHFSIGCCDINERRSRMLLSELCEGLERLGMKAVLEEKIISTDAGRIKLGFWAPTRPAWKTLPDDAVIARDVTADTADSDRRDRAAPISPFGCVGPMGVGYFWVDPDGSVRACCGNANIFNESLVIGNVNRESLSVIRERAARDPLLGVLAEGGPVGLALKMGREEVFNKRYTHRCELCHELLAGGKARSMFSLPAT